MVEGFHSHWLYAGNGLFLAQEFEIFRLILILERWSPLCVSYGGERHVPGNVAEKQTDTAETGP